MAKVIKLRNIKRALRLEPSDAVNYIISGRVIVKRDLLKKPELGSYLTCQGQLTASRGPQQPIEFKVNRVDYSSKCDPEKYPLAERNQPDLPESWFRRHLHLRPQASHFASMLRIRSDLELSMHMILKQMDFFNVHTPKLTANDSEASSDLFLVQRSKQLQKSKGSQASSSSSSEDSDEDEDSDGDTSYAATQQDCSVETQKRIMTGDYFGDKDVFMITSAQLHLECLAASLSRVYCLGPTFRAESSISRRHLCEFTMLEAEESNVTRLEPLMDRVESMVKFSAQYLAEVSEFKSDFTSLLDRNSNAGVFEKLAHSQNYIRMTYDEAIGILQKLASSSTLSNKDTNNGCLPMAQVKHGCDINRFHERQLLAHCNQVPIFITNYPKSLKPFYMKASGMVDGRQPDKVENFDLIAPIGGEICGGSLREDNLERLRENLRAAPQPGALNVPSPPRRAQNGLAGDPTPDGDKQQQQREDPFGWYLELREFGSFPHGGFGIGFERLIQSLLGIKNIRDTLAFPRWRGSCSM